MPNECNDQPEVVPMACVAMEPALGETSRKAFFHAWLCLEARHEGLK
jgi:hypothetical protein